jgi:nucleoid DNA-binding protein
MNLSKLAVVLRARFKAPIREDSRLAVDTILGGSIDPIASEVRVEIRGCGTFGARFRKTRIERNPRTGKQIQVPATRHPNFRAAKEMRESVDN